MGGFFDKIGELLTGAASSTRPAFNRAQFYVYHGLTHCCNQVSLRNPKAKVCNDWTRVCERFAFLADFADSKDSTAASTETFSLTVFHTDTEQGAHQFFQLLTSANKDILSKLFKTPESLREAFK